MVVAACKTRLSGRLHGHRNAGLHKTGAQKAVFNMPQSYSSSSQSPAPSARRKHVFTCTGRTAGTTRPSANQQLDGLHTVKAFTKAGLAVSSKHRHGTHVATGSFMGLMGQILKDMAPSVPSGCDLMVENICYHPAGTLTACEDSDASCILTHFIRKITDILHMASHVPAPSEHWQHTCSSTHLEIHSYSFTQCCNAKLAAQSMKLHV